MIIYKYEKSFNTRSRAGSQTDGGIPAQKQFRVCWSRRLSRQRADEMMNGNPHGSSLDWSMDDPVHAWRRLVAELRYH